MHRTKKRRGAFRPRLEALEDRSCPSCATGQIGDTLFITGDRLDNQIDISQLLGAVEVACDGGEAQLLRGVKHIVANTYGGNDAVTFTANFTPDPDDDLTLRVDLGAGDDTFTATYFPTETISPSPSDLPPGPCKLDVFGQQGNDRLNLFIGGLGPVDLFNTDLAVNFDGGLGSDTALIDITNVVVNGPMSLSYNGGFGDDVAAWDWEDVTVNAPLTQTMNFGGGGDVAAVNAFNVALNADAVTSFMGGGGADTIVTTWWATTVAPGASVMVDVDGGGGGDTVGVIVIGGTVARDALSSIEAHGGGGADVLRGSIVGLLADGGFVWCHDGGGGDDVIDARLDFDPNSRGMIDVEVMGSAGDDDLTLRIAGIYDSGLLTALVDGGDAYDIAHVSRFLLPFVVNCEEIFVLG